MIRLTTAELPKHLRFGYLYAYSDSVIFRFQAHGLTRGGLSIDNYVRSLTSYVAIVPYHSFLR